MPAEVRLGWGRFEELGQEQVGELRCYWRRWLSLARPSRSRTAWKALQPDQSSPQLLGRPNPCLTLGLELSQVRALMRRPLVRMDPVWRA